MEYVIISETIYPLTEKDESVTAAQKAMILAGLRETPVYVGDPLGAGGAAYKNGQILFAPQTITIIYYNAAGEEVSRQQTTDPWTRDKRKRWEAWLNDSNLEQVCEFDTFDLIAE